MEHTVDQLLASPSDCNIRLVLMKASDYLAHNAERTYADIEAADLMDRLRDSLL